MNEQTDERDAPKIVVHIDPPKPTPPPHPCEIGQHRWAWLVDGRQACGYCGRPR